MQDQEFFKEILLKNDGTFSFRLKVSIPAMKFIMNQNKNIKNPNTIRSYTQYPKTKRHLYYKEDTKK